jgi:hypothetical protein
MFRNGTLTQTKPSKVKAQIVCGRPPELKARWLCSRAINSKSFRNDTAQTNPSKVKAKIVCRRTPELKARCVVVQCGE